MFKCVLERASYAAWEGFEAPFKAFSDAVSLVYFSHSPSLCHPGLIQDLLLSGLIISLLIKF